VLTMPQRFARRVPEGHRSGRAVSGKALHEGRIVASGVLGKTARIFYMQDMIPIDLPPALDVQGKQPRSGCPLSSLRTRLRDAGLRPTRQRVSLGWLLFARGDRHVSAEMVFDEAMKARVPVSLATVYNTLHQFTQAGLLREVAVEGAKSYFDTNTDAHHHFYIEGEDRLVDFDAGALAMSRLPQAPDGFEITRVDVVVRVRPKPST
jgi:Fur family transcriptional regulator, iron response regulator